VLHMLDRQKPTATGMDGFGFCGFQPQLSLLHLPHCLITPSLRKWCRDSGRMPKIPVPTVASDYRPISVTPVLSRLVERRVVTSYIYPALNISTPGLNIANQYAFRPTGSTTAALVAIIIQCVQCYRVTSLFEFLYLTSQRLSIDFSGQAVAVRSILY